MSTRTGESKARDPHRSDLAPAPPAPVRRHDLVFSHRRQPNQQQTTPTLSRLKGVIWSTGYGPTNPPGAKLLSSLYRLCRTITPVYFLPLLSYSSRISERPKRFGKVRRGFLGKNLFLIHCSRCGRDSEGHGGVVRGNTWVCDFRSGPRE